MKKLTLILTFLLLSTLIYSQNGFEDWDLTYKIVDVEKLIENEIKYAKEIEKDTSSGHYYVAMEKFRFIAEYNENIRPIDNEVFNSMRRVLQIKTGNPEVLNNLVSKEIELTVGKLKFWMPIQNQLIESFQNELKKGDKVLLYTLFMNEHKFEGGIINTFLISDFLSEWDE